MNHRKRIIYTFLLILIISGHQLSAQSRRLFLVQEGAKYGYIDRQGKMIIPPRFYDARNFLEGLAAVREGGTFGYIDTTGHFVIPARFDRAENFKNGVAKVYEKGKPFYIDKSGNKAFDLIYTDVAPFYSNRAVARTLKGLYGIIDRQGKRLTEMKYTYIRNFRNGYALAKHMNDTLESLIDTSGQKIRLPYTYTRIYDFPNSGHFIVEMVKDGREQIGLFDSTFRQVFLKDKAVLNTRIFYGDFHDGLMKVGLNPNSMSGPQHNDHAYMDTTGAIIYLPDDIIVARDFWCNRAVIAHERVGGWKYQMIDKNGQPVSDRLFNGVEQYEGRSTNGTAVVSVDSGVGIIDSNGVFIVQPKFKKIESPGLIGDIFIFSETGPDRYSIYGISRKDGHYIIPAIINRIERVYEEDSLIACSIGQREVYMDFSGKIVWQTQDTTSIYSVNTAYKGHNYYRVDALPVPGRTMKKHDNYPLTIHPSDKRFPANKISIIADTTSKSIINGRKNGFKVYIANTTHRKVPFSSMDNTMRMHIEVLTPDNKWNNIELSMDGISCGNSAYDVILGPQQYWQIACPVYEGSIKTRMRVALEFYPNRPRDYRNETVIYSNEFEGSINPGQLVEPLSAFLRNEIPEEFFTPVK